MYLSGPSRVSDGSSITVTASGFDKAYSIKFEVAGLSGNVGFDVKETRGASSVSYTESMSFPGAERINAYAQDEFGGTIESASHSFDVVSTSRARRVRDDGPGSGGGYVLNVEAPGRVRARSEWRYRVSGLKDMHSLLIELYGANGGLFRLFPRGRDVMEHAIVPMAPGRTTVVLIGRGARLQTLVAVAGDIEVDAADAPAGLGFAGGYDAIENFAPIAPLGVAKPPFALSQETTPGGYGAASPAPSASGTLSLDALIEAKKAELLSRLGKR